MGRNHCESDSQSAGYKISFKFYSIFQNLKDCCKILIAVEKTKYINLVGVLGT
jgi:hypothetical protein